MAMTTVLLGAALAAAAWAAMASLAARETVLARARTACSELGVQLLDDTVALAGLGAARDAHGRLRLRRLYRFEVSVRGDDRIAGTAVLIGRHLEQLRLELPEGAVVMGPAKFRILH